MNEQTILSILLENEPGALSRIVGLFSQRAFNIESLTVAPTDDKSLSRITIVTSGDHQIIEQITKQVNKLVDVLKVSELNNMAHIERELMFVKVNAKTPEARDEIKRTADIFRGQIVDSTNQLYTVQLSGKKDKLNAFIRSIRRQSDIIEIVRSGCVAIARGAQSLSV
ncbi:acetolactate synthase small subunit [Aliikangiella sp. G2MR2-5]|uniref:acetolactate synthase small subunit n=1 Tax=Aliikangiella sp. G2MR2-5 TaxID=2788943 RepID=UPI0018AA8DCA|nr:acetolactate synthase small subunit [Aliikangiella sp. G2MR2-5]